MKISSVNEDVIWHKWRKFYKGPLLRAKMVWVWFQKTLFLSEHAAVYFYQSKSCLQILKTTEYQLTEYQLNDVTITSFCFVNKSTAEGYPGTKVSACEDLGRVTTRRNLQVDREFQEASASLCKRWWRTFWAFTVTLLIDLTYVCYFCNMKAKRSSKMWSLTNCLLMLRSCSVEIFVFNVQSLNEVELVLEMVNYSRNSAWKFGRKIQNDWDNNIKR